MVFDAVRNAAYRQALEAVVTPESVVLDLGAGLGVHGLLAAQLGAKKVYLVEPQDVIGLAKQVARANGRADQVTCIRGRIEEISLPEPVDVIISAFTGNFLLEEDLLPSLFYARETYLKPSGHLIPHAAVMEAVPVSLPDFYEKQIDAWSQPQRDLDFSLARRPAANTIYYDRAALKQAQYLADPLPLQHFDFYTAQKADCRASVEYTLTSAGTCHSLAGWFSMQLGDQWLSTAPHASKVHWSPAFLPLDSPLALQPGEWLKFQIVRSAYAYESCSLISERQVPQSGTDANDIILKVGGMVAEAMHQNVVPLEAPDRMFDKNADSTHGGIGRFLLLRQFGSRVLVALAGLLRGQGKPLPLVI